MKRAGVIMGVAVLFSVIGACGNEKETERIDTYRQDFTTTAASLVIEGGGVPQALASGGLINREGGVFLTAKHYTDGVTLEVGGMTRVFFNGKAYRGFVPCVAPQRDAAIVQIIDSFDPSEFPDAIRIAAHPVRKGDSVVVMGIHLHSEESRKLNIARDIPEYTLPILSEYYGVVTYDEAKMREMAFDSIPATVIATDSTGFRFIKDPGDLFRTPDEWEEFRIRSHTYTVLKTAYDHSGTFGGLSGGPVRSTEGELVGIVTGGPNRPPHTHLIITPIHDAEMRELLRCAQHLQ